MNSRLVKFGILMLVAMACLLIPRPASAHCDTMSGPVAVDVKAALESGNVTPVLKWVAPQDESQVRDAFAKARTVRALSPEAKTLADNYFMETVVRLHRMGEGMPFTGMKLVAGPDEAMENLADNTLAAGSADDIITALNNEVDLKIQKLFNEAVEARKHKDDSVEAGRKYVEAYMKYFHFVMAIHQGVTGEGMMDGRGMNSGMHGSGITGHDAGCKCGLCMGQGAPSQGTQGQAGTCPTCQGQQHQCGCQAAPPATPAGGTTH